MADLWSPVDEVTKLELYSFPASCKAIKAVKAAHVDGVIVVLAENGKIYIHGRRFSGKYSYLFGVYPFTNGLIKGLVKIGAITKAAGDRHLRLAKEAEEKSSRRARMKGFAKSAADAGITLTPKQRRLVSEVCGDDSTNQ